MQQNGQDKNPAAWYYLGRIYLQMGDLYGADSSLTKAAQLAPNCAEEINNYRKNAWVALIKAGSKFEDEKNVDSALALYREAGTIYQGSPVTYYQIAAIMNDKGNPDSAAAYFGKAAAAPAESQGHDRGQDPEPLGIQRRRHPAEQEGLQRCRRGVRAIPQVGTRRQRSQAWSRVRVSRTGSGRKGPGHREGTGERGRRRCGTWCGWRCRHAGPHECRC